MPRTLCGVLARRAKTPHLGLRPEQRELAARRRHVVAAAPADEARVAGVAEHALEGEDAAQSGGPSGCSMGFIGMRFTFTGSPRRSFASFRASPSVVVLARDERVLDRDPPARGSG